MNEIREKILIRAEFDTKLKIYWYMRVVGLMTVLVAANCAAPLTVR